jgi:hypothetical protein
MTTTINASTSSGLVNTADTSGVLQLQTASTAAVTITAGQLVGIGNTSPSYPLDVKQTSTGNIAGFRATSASYASDGVVVLIDRNTSNNTFNAMAYYNTGASAYRFKVADSGAIATAGSISLGTATPATSGIGVQFPATQSASSDANTLDDYEEGTWTPTVGGNSTYSAQVGRYTKVGNIVSVTFDFSINTLGTGSTSNITNLPFATISEMSATGCVSYYTGTTVAFTFIGCYASGGTTNVAFVGNTGTAATTVAYNGIALFGNGTRILGSIVYRVL